MEEEEKIYKEEGNIINFNRIELLKAKNDKEFTLKPGNELKECINNESHYRIEIIKDSKASLIKVEHQIYTDLKKGSSVEVLPFQTYRISNLSNKEDLIVKYTIL